MVLPQLLATKAALQANVLPRPWRTATVDYSAANEYIAAHYAHVHSKEYFASPGQASEPIYDGRLGVWDDEAAAAVPASLASCGFALQPSPTSVTCWSDADAVRSVYLPQLRAQLTAAVEGSAAHGKVAEVIFWHPVLRGESGFGEEDDDDSEGGDGGGVVRSGYVSLAHVDTDVNAYAEQPAAALAHLVRSSAVANPWPMPWPWPPTHRLHVHVHCMCAGAEQRSDGARQACSDARGPRCTAGDGASLLHHQLLA